MQNTEVLERMGLDKKESALYLALLESGPETISALARATGLHRPIIYKVLPRLVDKGLVTSGPKGKLTQYVAERPEKLKLLLDDLQSQFDELLPQLKSSYRAVGKKPVVKFLDGKQGITAVFDDLITTLKRGDIFYRYSSAKDLRASERYLPNNYRVARDNKQLERLVITSEARAGAKKPRLEREIKVVPTKYDLFDDDITQLIYGNRVAFIDYNSETVTVIVSASFAGFQRKIFKLLYSKL